MPGIVAKDGAEGVYAAALPDGRAAVLKIADGSVRARQPVMTALLGDLGVAADLPVPPVLGHGRPVGAMTAVPGSMRP